MSDSLFSFLNAANPLSKTIIDRLKSCLYTKVIPKKEIILREGQVSNFIYFVEKGMMRSFYVKNDQKITSWFVYDNDVITSVNSFFSRTPSMEYIQAIEDTLVHFVHYDDLQQLYKECPEFNINGRLLLTRFCLISEERLYNLRKQRSIDRYRFLSEKHPQILLRAPLGDIASYLGISLETLSRIRSQK
jgi:CRP/FNR family transcriptional regulator, anaerobic regulatory protein